MIVSGMFGLHGPLKTSSLRGDSKESLVQAGVGSELAGGGKGLGLPAGPRYDTRTIVWICLTLITGLVVLLLLLICKKR